MQELKNKLLECPLRIEICGGIASGKTTLANLMTHIGMSTILENFQTNPFWEAFYSEPGKYIFETEVSFMLQHYHQIKKKQTDNKISICDYSFSLDVAYAEIGLKDSKLKAFHTIYEEIKKELPPPALLVHLNCDAQTELDRIRKRGRAVEDSINIEFLKTLNGAVEDQVANAKKNKIKVLSIDSAKKNFADDESVKQEMLRLVSDTLAF